MIVEVMFVGRSSEVKKTVLEEVESSFHLRSWLTFSHDDAHDLTSCRVYVKLPSS
jgi:hypothetical protein